MLHWACHFGQSEVVEMLLRAGANSHAKDYLGREPVDVAAEHGFSADIGDIFSNFDSNQSKTGEDTTTLSSVTGS